MDNAYFMFLNGIRTESNDLSSWHFRACDWVENEFGGQASTYHYEVKATTKWILQGRHVDRLADRIRRFSRPGRKLILTGHSNGGDLLRLAFQKHPDLRCHTINMIGSAAPARFDKNGLNDALRQDRVGYVNVWYDEADPALRVASAIGWLMGYGDLGREGPKEVAKLVRERVGLIHCPGWGHSGYFDEPSGRFEATMSSIVTYAQTK